jgi:hypothetical protein
MASEVKGERMTVVPLNRMASDAAANRRIVERQETNWARVAAAGSLLTGGVLLLTGNKRAGLVAGTAGAALALIDQQEAVRACWDALPGYIDGVQRLLTRVENTVMELAEQRERLHQIFTK